jgi:serine protease Do
MKWKQLLLIVVISSVSALASVWGYNKFIAKKQSSYFSGQSGNAPVNYAGFFEGGGSGTPAGVEDFTKASGAAVPAVVHIKTKVPAQKVSNSLPRSRQSPFGQSPFDDFFNDFFEFGPSVIPEQRASGSGVIISEDGYIITNNHVISSQQGGVADEITVTLSNKKVFKARLVGKDPNSDLAVLKIDAAGLPYMIYGNSDELKLGQWVLAVGYPLSLEATVTAGIVSAKARAIGINQRQGNMPIESFIQTDAAVNQGNSGGPLITTDGKLVGINSAIYAPTGYYTGYSFAIPVNIVKKIVNDLIEFGDVKRGFLGINYAQEDIPEEELKKLGIKENDGVVVLGVNPKSGAEAAGLKKGDVITKINDNAVASGPEMAGQIASMKPGDKVKVTYKRAGTESSTTVTLKENVGNTEELAKNNLTERLGAELENLDKKKATQYEIEGGVVVKTITPGSALSKTRMQEGFIITSLNGRPVTSIEDINKLLSQARGAVRVEGIYPGYEGTYTYPLNVN